MSPFERLGVAPEADLAAIRRAYARRLKDVRPDEDPAGFQALREARDAAVALAERRAAALAAVAALEQDEAERTLAPDRERPGTDEAPAADDADDEAAPSAATAGGADDPGAASPGDAAAGGAGDTGHATPGDAAAGGASAAVVVRRIPASRPGPVRGSREVTVLRLEASEVVPRRPPRADVAAYADAVAALREAPGEPDLWAALRRAVQDLPFERAGDAELAVIRLAGLVPAEPPIGVAREIARLSVLFGWDDSDAAILRALGRHGAERVARIVAAGRTAVPPRSGAMPPPLPDGRVRTDANGIVDVSAADLARVLGAGSAATVTRYREARVRGHWRMRLRLLPLLFGPVWLATRGAWRAALVAWAATTLAWSLFVLDAARPGVPDAMVVAGSIAGPLVWFATRLSVALLADRIVVAAAARTLARGRTRMGTDLAALGFFGAIGFAVRCYFGLIAPIAVAYGLVGSLVDTCHVPSPAASCVAPPPPPAAPPPPSAP